MPFDSDKQRRYLFSQKPEVAKQIAYKEEGGNVWWNFFKKKKRKPPQFKDDAAIRGQTGGGVYSDGIYDEAAKWHNARLKDVPQHVGFVDDPDDITETAATNPDDPYGGKYINPDRKAPLGKYTDLATYYTPKGRDMGRGERELAKIAENNAKLAEQAATMGFEFAPVHKSKGGVLSLSDDAADLARRNIDRIKSAKEIERKEWLDANKYKRGAQMPAHLRKEPSLSDLKEPVDVITDFVPGVGEAKDVARAASNVAAGNYGAAALDAAAAGVGLVPGVGDAAAAGIRSLKKAPLGARNVHGFERAQQRLPDLVPDQQTWNNINDAAQRGENIEVGAITRRDREGKGGSKDSRPGQEARNAAVTIDGKQVPVVVVPHKNPKYKWHIITVRDRGYKNDKTDTLGGREYNRGGPIGGSYEA